MIVTARLAAPEILLHQRGAHGLLDEQDRKHDGSLPEGLDVQRGAVLWGAKRTVCRAHQAYSSGEMPARTIVQIATDIEQVNARIVRLEADIQTQRVKLAGLVQELTQSEALVRLGTRLEVENVQDEEPAVGSRPARAPRVPASGADRERRALGRPRAAEKVPPVPDQDPVAAVETKAAEQPAPTS